MAKKQPWDIPKDEQKQVIKKAAKAAKTKDLKSSSKMVRIGDDEHFLLKKMAVWEGKTMQEYFEELVRREFKKVFPS